MGKTLIQQRRGKGSPTYRTQTHRSPGPATYAWGDEQTGTVTDILHDPARTAPLAKVEFEEGDRYMIVPNGLAVGDEVQYGGRPQAGNILTLDNIPEGTPVCNVELQPGDGGTLARAAGTSCLVVSHGSDGVVVRLPSKEFKTLPRDCRATIGSVAGAGRKEKPFAKAGSKHYAKRARGKRYPRTRAKAMNPVAHPFGGNNMGKHKTRSRHAPPGQKVGSIAAKQTGKKERS